MELVFHLKDIDAADKADTAPIKLSTDKEGRAVTFGPGAERIHKQRTVEKAQDGMVCLQIQVHNASSLSVSDGYI